MKKIVTPFVFFVACVLSLVSCSNTDTTPTTDGSTLIPTPNTVALIKTDSAKTVDLKLSCGCGFTVKVTSVTGDSTDIKYTPAQAMGDTISQHSLNFHYSPSNTPSGTHTLTVNFQAQKQIYTYTSSVLVTVTN